MVRVSFLFIMLYTFMRYFIKEKSFWFGIFLFLQTALVVQAAPKLEYTVSMEAPQTHYFEVEMTLTGIRQRYLDLKMATWTPGSYLIREYARNIDALSASSGDKTLKAEKINKNTWRVYSNNASQVKVKYQLYAYELTVRTNFLDASHGYINGASTFLYLDKKQNLPSTLTIKPYQGWKEISTGLRPVGTDKWVLQVPDYDILVDSPIEIGNQEIFSFQAAGVPHEVAMYNPPAYNQERLKADMIKVTEAATSIVGVNPNKDYTFIVLFAPRTGGGLEHLNSTTLQATPLAFATENGYKSFLGLVAHEYFHLWNVKRIRPIALGPFNYENENYTHMLWVSEGITSYYSPVLLRIADVYSPEQFLNVAAASISTIENIPGNKIQSAAESSFDAWIKNYRPNENSNNATISYYSRGAVIGNLLDLEIIGATKGQKSLDDVFRYLWAEYYEKRKRGYTDVEFQQAAERAAGHSLEDFFQNNIYGTQTFDYDRFFRYAGLKLVDKNAGQTKTFLGANTSAASGKLLITSVLRDSPAWNNGINVNDELVAINGDRIDTNLNALLALYQPQDKVKITVSRAGQLLDLDVTLANDPTVNFALEQLPDSTPEQKIVLQKWLRVR